MLEDARLAFNAFFERYPYCYGYWKKYADLEKRHEKVDLTEQAGFCLLLLHFGRWAFVLLFCEVLQPKTSTGVRETREFASTNLFYRASMITVTSQSFHVQLDNEFLKCFWRNMFKVTVIW